MPPVERQVCPASRSNAEADSSRLPAELARAAPTRAATEQAAFVEEPASCAAASVATSFHASVGQPLGNAGSWAGREDSARASEVRRPALPALRRLRCPGDRDACRSWSAAPRRRARGRPLSAPAPRRPGRQVDGSLDAAHSPIVARRASRIDRRCRRALSLAPSVRPQPLDHRMARRDRSAWSRRGSSRRSSCSRVSSPPVRNRRAPSSARNWMLCSSPIRVWRRPDASLRSTMYRTASASRRGRIAHRVWPVMRSAARVRRGSARAPRARSA